MSIAKELKCGIITEGEYNEAAKRFNESERMCDKCKHYVDSGEGYFACEKWKCQPEYGKE